MSASMMIFETDHETIRIHPSKWQSKNTLWINDRIRTENSSPQRLRSIIGSRNSSDSCQTKICERMNTVINRRGNSFHDLSPPRSSHSAVAPEPEKSKLGFNPTSGKKSEWMSPAAEETSIPACHDTLVPSLSRLPIPLKILIEKKSCGKNQKLVVSSDSSLAALRHFRPLPESSSPVYEKLVFVRRQIKRKFPHLTTDLGFSSRWKSPENLAYTNCSLESEMSFEFKTTRPCKETPLGMRSWVVETLE